MGIYCQNRKRKNQSRTGNAFLGRSKMSEVMMNFVQRRTYPCGAFFSENNQARRFHISGFRRFEIDFIIEIIIITSNCISYLSIHIQCHLCFFIQQSCKDWPVAVLCDVCQLCGRGGVQSAHGAGTDHTVTSWLFELSTFSYISFQIQFPNSLSALIPLKLLHAIIFG